MKNEYSKEWECYYKFPVQYVENQDFIEVQICHQEPGTEDAHKWGILPLLKTEAKVLRGNTCSNLTTIVNPLAKDMWEPCLMYI